MAAPNKLRKSITVLIDEPVADAIEREAERQHGAVSTIARHVLSDWAAQALQAPLRERAAALTPSCIPFRSRSAPRDHRCRGNSSTTRPRQIRTMGVQHDRSRNNDNCHVTRCQRYAAARRHQRCALWRVWWPARRPSSRSQFAAPRGAELCDCDQKHLECFDHHPLCGSPSRVEGKNSCENQPPNKRLFPPGVGHCSRISGEVGRWVVVPHRDSAADHEREHCAVPVPVPDRMEPAPVPEHAKERHQRRRGEEEITQPRERTPELSVSS